MPSLTLDIKPKSPLAQRILEGVRDRVKFSKREFAKRHAKWIADEEAALAYLPEREVDASRRLVREGGKPQYTTIVLPYSYGVLMASHTYWTTVFLSRAPILQYTGRHGESQQQIQALEALIDYQVQVGGMLVPFYIWLLDVGKYGQGTVGTFWEEEESIISEIVEMKTPILGVFDTGKTKKKKISRRVPGYVGNRIYNIRPFDFLPDPRVPLARFQEGEYCAVYFELGWNTVLRRRDQGFYVAEAVQALQRAGKGSISDREAGSSQLELPSTDDIFSELTSRKTSDVVKGYECHIEIIPSAWGLGKSSSPEKWVFSTDSTFEHVLGAQPLGAFHNLFPFHVIELEPEGYAIANRGIPEIIKPVQDTMDWLVNSHFYNVRKTLNNQFIVDPSRIVMKDVLDPMPGNNIRLKAAAYGTRAADAIHQFPVVDVTRSHFADMQNMIEIGQRAVGVNDQILGLLSQGGRKTAVEVRTSSSFGVNRLKSSAEYFGAMGWAPMSQMLVQHSQQYYEQERKFRLVGDLAQQSGPQFVDVDPESIQGFFDFVPVDGTLPVDRFAQANLWRELLGQMRQFPQLLAEYDVSKIFAWVAQLAGLKNINQFKIEMMPDEQAALAQQKGNIVPLANQAKVAGKDLTRVPEPGQISGMGTTG